MQKLQLISLHSSTAPANDLFSGRPGHFNSQFLSSQCLSSLNQSISPATPSHPHGDPSLEYYKFHAGEQIIVFGTARRAGLPDRDGGVATAASDHIRSFSSTSRNTLCYFTSVLNSHPPFSNP
jgi:hypothetical protein